MTIKLTNTLTNRVYFLDNLSENAYSSDMFYCFDIQLPVLDDGEYEYILFDDGNELIRGICQIGDYEPTNTTYNNNNDEIIVYNG